MAEPELPRWDTARPAEIRPGISAGFAGDWMTQAMGAPPPGQPPVQPPPAASPDAALLAKTIWGEARGEPPAGQAAVGATVLNRLKSGRWGPTVESVVKAPNQFESWTKGIKVDEKSPAYQAMLRLAQRLVAGQERDPTGGAMYFHTAAAPVGREKSWPPPWAKKLQKADQIGAHLFYRE